MFVRTIALTWSGLLVGHIDVTDIIREAYGEDNNWQGKIWKYNDIFGDPTPLACVKYKLSDMKADIDDMYHCLLSYPENILASISIEVLSRPKATRELHILGSHGRVSYSADDNFVKYIKVGQNDWTILPFDSGTLEPGYINSEEPYINEMKAFIDAVEKCDRFLFPNTLEKDFKILKLLNKLEQLSER